MDRNNHHIDDLFRNEVGNIEILPPDSVWQAIEDKLDKKRRIRIFLYRLGMAASFALIVGIAGNYFYNTNNSGSIKVEMAQNNNKTIDSDDHIIESPINKSNNTTIQKKGNEISQSNSVEKKFAANTESRIIQEQQNINNNEHSRNIDDDGNSIILEKEANLAYLSPHPCILIKETENKQPLENILKNVKTDYVQAEELELVADNTQPKMHHWSIEGQFAPQYSYRNLTAVSGSLAQKSDYNRSESGLMSYAGNFKVNYEANRRLTVQTGLGFSLMGQQLEDIYVITPSNSRVNTLKLASSPHTSWVNNSLGIIVDGSENQIYDISPDAASNQYTYFNKVSEIPVSTNEPVSEEGPKVQSLNSRIVQQIKVIEIPLLVRYKIIDRRRVDWNILGGLSTNILIGSDALLKNDNSTTKFGKTIGLKPYNYIGTVGFGLSYSLTKSISLQFEPTFKYYLNYISQSDEFRSHPFSYAMFTGIKYQF